MEEPVICIKKYDPSKHQGVLEFQPERTIIYVGSLYMSALLCQGAFTKLFLPDGVWLAVVDGMTIGAILFVGCIVLF